MSDKAVYTEHIYQEYSYKHVSPIEQREEVVRCRDCKLLVKKGSRLYCDLNAGGFPEVEPNGFCAWGERRDG